VLPEVDVLWLTEDLPEMSGFQRFLAAALGCYDDAKGQLDGLLLRCIVERLTSLKTPEKPGKNALGCQPGRCLCFMLFPR
jgi:hypothetical protein